MAKAPPKAPAKTAATKSAGKASATPTPSTRTDVMDWEKEMEEAAKVAATMEANAGGVPRFSIRGGVLSVNDVVVPGGVMGVIIMDSILENAFYDEKFDQDKMVPPVCFALGRDDTKLAPHKNVVEKGQDQHPKCTGCPMNTFGTADTGKGKACQNRRRLMVIPGGDIDGHGKFTAFNDVDHFTSVPGTMFGVPPTSVKGYATFVKQIAAGLKLPPHGIFTKVTVRPDPKSQVKVTFEPIGKIPRELMPIMVTRHKEMHALIEQPYNLDVEDKPAASTGRGGRSGAKVNPRPPVKKGGKY